MRILLPQVSNPQKIGRRIAFLLPLIILVAPVVTAQTIEPSPEAVGLDEHLFRSINNRMDPTRDGIFEYVDRAAIPAFFVIPIAYAGIRGVQNGYIDNSSYLFLLTETLTLGISAGLKAATDRTRPFQALDNVKTKHLWSAVGSSFPSGHAAQAFSIATFLALRHGSALVVIPAYVWAGIVSYGRIYLGLHYPSDVAAGVIIGSGIAVLVWVFKEELIHVKNRIFSSDDVQLSLGGVHRGHSLGIARISIPF